MLGSYNAICPYECMNIWINEPGRVKYGWLYTGSDDSCSFACISCISRKRLCVRLKGVNEGLALVVHPLWEKWREGRTAQEIAY